MINRLVFFTVILIFFSSRIYCQNENVSDTTYSPFYLKTLNAAGIQTFDSENLLEFRIWITPELSPYNQILVRLYQTNDSIWNAEKYRFSWIRKKAIIQFKHKSRLFSEYERVGNPNSLKSTIDSLTSLGILTLPDWYSIKDSCYKNEGLDENGYELKSYVMVTDGASYCFEILTKDLKRKYQYHCPVSYFKHCNKLTELDSIIRILRILFREFEIKDRIC